MVYTGPAKALYYNFVAKVVGVYQEVKGLEKHVLCVT